MTAIARDEERNKRADPYIYMNAYMYTYIHTTNSSKDMNSSSTCYCCFSS